MPYVYIVTVKLSKVCHNTVTDSTDFVVAVTSTWREACRKIDLAAGIHVPHFDADEEPEFLTVKDGWISRYLGNGIIEEQHFKIHLREVDEPDYEPLC